MKRAQLAVPFHWIYILVAGGILLMFFIGIVVKQQGSAEDTLSAVVSQKLDGIFTGIAVSEKATITIPIPNREVYFTCDKDDVSNYRIGEVGKETDSNFQPIFAPAEFKTSELVSWSEEFNMPYKIINFVMVGSPAVSMFVVYDEQNSQSIALKNEIMDTIPEQFQVEAIALSAYQQDSLPTLTDFATIILLADPPPMPRTIAALQDRNVRFIHVNLGAQKAATYYKKNGATLQREGTASIIPSNDRINSALYAALFSDSSEMYFCNMRKAFERMRLLTNILLERASELKISYPTADPICPILTDPQLIQQLKDEITSCSADMTGQCFARVFAFSNEINTRNEELLNNNCATLY